MIKLKNKNKEKLFNVIRILGDIIVINAAFVLSFYIRLDEIFTTNIEAYFRSMPFILIFSILLFSMFNLYKDQTRKPLSDILYSFIPASFVIILFSVTLSYFFQTYKFPRSVFLITLPILIIFMIIWRYLLIRLEKNYESPKGVVIIGSKELIEKLISNINRHTNNGYYIKEVINIDRFHSLSEDQLEEELDEINPDILFITSDMSINDKKELFYISLEKEWEISIVPEFYEIMISGGDLKQIGEFPVYNIKSLKERNGSILKRSLDVTFSTIGLIILSPIILLVALSIKLTSRGPIFYKQRRVSEYGKEFEVYKFRTMVQNAEEQTGPVLSNNKDSRVTKVGKFLRKTRLDEIPQLINVLKGDMSIIGPRPERPHFVNKFKKEIEDYEFRHHIKSGITGLAQINGFYSTDPEEKLRMDLIYANNNNLIFDLKIILNTLKVILIGHKAE